MCWLSFRSTGGGSGKLVRVSQRRRCFGQLRYPWIGRTEGIKIRN